MSSIIQEGDQVLLRRDKTSGVFQVKTNRQIYFEKVKFKLDALIGEPFGTTFQVNAGHLVRISDPDKFLNDMMEGDATGGTGKDNRDLVAKGDNQKLTQDEILQMKEDGKSGTEIVKQLMTNSETFDNKTEYSQRKYLNKKLKKHVHIFTVMKPTARLVIDWVYNKNPEKIGCLRVDSLSQILTAANIMSGVNVAIMDTLQGMVLGSVMERMGGVGKIVQFYPGSDLNRHLFHCFNFPPDFKENVYNYPLKKLSELQVPNTSEPTGKTDDLCVDKVGDANGEKGDVDCVAENNDTVNTIRDETSECVKNQDCETSVKTEKAETDGCKRKRSGMDEQAMIEKVQKVQLVKDFILEKKFDCLIIACRHHVTPIVLALLEYVLPSRPIVVFSAHKEPLVDCYQTLKKTGKVLNLRLNETWYREYQVLPARTHPNMQMTGTGGYLLSCTTVT